VGRGARDPIPGLASFLITVCVAVIAPVGRAENLRGSSTPDAAALKGSVGGYPWEVAIRRGAGESGARTPCLSVELAPPRSKGGTGTNTGCHPLTPYPLAVGQSINSGAAKRSIVGMAYPLEVHSVRVWLKHRPSYVVRLDSLSSERARKAHIERLSFGAVAFSGPSCLARVTAFDSKGRKVGPEFAMPCVI